MDNLSFSEMNVKDLKKYLQDRWVSISGQSSLVEIATAVQKLSLPLDPNFELDQKESKNTNILILINDVEIPNPFLLSTVNNFIDLPPFSLYNIFNYFNYSTMQPTTTDRDSPRINPLTSIDSFKMVTSKVLQNAPWIRRASMCLLASYDWQ